MNSFNQNVALEGGAALEEVVVTGFALQGSLSGATISKRKQSRYDQTLALQNVENLPADDRQF